MTPMEQSERKTQGTIAIEPRPYDLAQSQEAWRLLREVHGYLHTCRRDHHGTDWDGRRHALDALETILGGGYDLTIRRAS